MKAVAEIAIRHDQRKVSVPSNWSLMYWTPCSTDMSSVKGTLYTSLCSAVSDSGR